MKTDLGSYSSLCALYQGEDLRIKAIYIEIHFLLCDPMPHAILTRTSATVCAGDGILGNTIYYSC